MKKNYFGKIMVIGALIYFWAFIPGSCLIKNLIWNDRNFFDNCKIACNDYFDILKKAWKYGLWQK